MRLLPRARDTVLEIRSDAVVLASGLKLLHLDNATLGWHLGDVVSVQGPAGPNGDELECAVGCRARLLEGGGAAIRGLDVFEAARFVVTLLGTDTEKVVVVSDSREPLDLNLRTTSEQAAVGALAHAAGLEFTHTEEGYVIGSPREATLAVLPRVAVGQFRAEHECFTERPLQELKLEAIAYHHYGYSAALSAPSSRGVAAAACMLRSNVTTEIGQGRDSATELGPRGLQIRDGMTLALARAPALYEWTRADVPELRRQLESGSPREWEEAAFTLGRLGAEGAAALPSLVAIIQRTQPQPDDKVYRAYESLKYIGPSAIAAVPALRELLVKRPEDAETVVDTLDAIGESAVRAARVELEAILLDPTRDDELRWAVVRCLERLGRDSIPIYLALLQSNEPNIHGPLEDIRVAAGMSLANIGEAGQVAALELMVDPRTTAQVRHWYTSEEAIPDGAPDYVRKRLVTALEDPDRGVRLFAIDTIGGFVFQHEALSCALRRVVNDRDPEVRKAASQVLRQWSVPAGVRCPSLSSVR